jgi:PAS domain S-box-containing protein
MDTSQHLTDLRRKAEERLATVMSSFPEKSVEDMQALVHDLHVHQIELTLQNEELRSTQAELEASRQNYADLYQKYANLYDVAPVGYCTLDESGCIQDINLTAATQLGIERAALLNTRLYQYILEEDRDTFFLHQRKAFDTGTRQTCELRLFTHDDTPFYAQLETVVIQAGSERFGALSKNAEASTTNHCFTTISDITDRKHAEELLQITLREKDLLMQEILHRTKNNMGAIINLLYLLTLRHPENAQMVDIFQDLEQRIRAMQLVQQQLYQSENFAEIDLKAYLDDLASEMFYTLRVGETKLCLDTETVIVSPNKAITCGLLLNELLINALKYAFPEKQAVPGQTNEIRVALQRTDAETLEMQVSDNGVGLPEDFDLEHLKSLGLSLVPAFVQQLEGTFEVTSDHGTCWRIRFPQHS